VGSNPAGAPAFPRIDYTGLGFHLSFEAPTRESVNQFYQTALSHGGRDAGSAGPRPEYTPPFYGAFIFDPDGFKIEAVCRSEE
jgi:catechol 2,3-dioxygenase-like lactoylglutathione lyase family enzyme